MSSKIDGIGVGIEIGIGFDNFNDELNLEWNLTNEMMNWWSCDYGYNE